MANETQLQLLRTGVDAWNRWRQGHPNLKPDLVAADLRGANLGRANLGRANLSLA
ncbi:MAG: pentapeptide repeat-containing protein, partial [Anaerolineae bacterium]